MQYRWIRCAGYPFGHRLRFLATPHIPHNWEAGLRFDETTATLLCGDLFTHTGQVPALTESVCVTPALAAEVLFHATGPTTTLAPTLEQLAALGPATLAIMHGSSSEVTEPGSFAYFGTVTPNSRTAMIQRPLRTAYELAAATATISAMPPVSGQTPVASTTPTSQACTVPAALITGSSALPSPKFSRIS